MKRALGGVVLLVGCAGVAAPPHMIETHGAVAAVDAPPPFVSAARCPPPAEAHAEGAVARQLLDARHTREIVGLAFSPNGHLLASASNDGSVRVWDAVHDVGVRAVNRVAPNTPLAWSDDRSLAFQQLGYLAVQYDVATGAISAPPSPGASHDLVRAPASSGGKWLQVETMSRRINLVDAAAKRLDRFELSTGEKLDSSLNDVTFSGDAATVAAAYAHDAVVVRATSPNAPERVVHIAGAEQMERIGLGPDGALAAVSTRIGAWSYVDVVATQSDAKPSRLPWPAAEGLRLANGGGNGGGPHVSDLAMSSRLVAAATTSGVFVWSLDGRKLAWSRAIPPELSVPVVRGADDANRVAFSPDGVLLACGTSSGRLLVYDAASGRLQGEPRREDAASSVRSRVPRRNAVIRFVASSDPVYTHASNVSEWAIDDARLDRRTPSTKARSDRRRGTRTVRFRFPSRSGGRRLRRPLRARGGRCPWREARDVRRRVERRRSVAREDATRTPRRRRPQPARDQPARRARCSQYGGAHFVPSERTNTAARFFRCRRCSPRTACINRRVHAIGRWRHLGRENWEGARPNPPSTADGGPAVGDLAGQRGIRGVRLDA